MAHAAQGLQLTQRVKRTPLCGEREIECAWSNHVLVVLILIKLIQITFYIIGCHLTLM